MKSRDQILLEEAYLKVLTGNKSITLESLIEDDHKLIDELIEEGFGDWLKKTGGAIKGGVQKATQAIKQTLTAGLATTLVKAIISAVPKDELENLVTVVAKGQVPKDKTAQIKDLIVKQPDSASPVKESIEDTKAYLASILFTEANITLSLQNSGLLLEAKSGRELQKFAKEVAAKINEIYPKNKQAMAAAIPNFTNSVSKYLGLPQQAPTQSSSTQATQSTQAAPGASNQTTPSAAQASPSTPNQAASSQPGVINKIENAIPTGKGLVSKVMGFVKSHPKISAVAGAALLGIVVAAFAGSAPVVAPALIAAVKGAGITGTTSIVKQMIGGEKVDLKQAGKSALVGGALGGVGSVLATGLGSIASSVTGMFSSGHGASAQANTPDNAAHSSNKHAGSTGSREIASTREYVADQEKWAGGRPPVDSRDAFSRLQEVPGSKYREITYKDGSTSWEAVDGMSDEDIERKKEWLKRGGGRNKAVSSFRAKNKDLLDDTFGANKY